MSSSEVVLKVSKEGVALITLSNPGKRNAMDEHMAERFASVVSQVSSNERVRVVVISGEGEAFSAGGDLSMLEGKKEREVEQNKHDMLDFYDKFLSVRSISVPVIAALNGHAIGAGLCLAMACDFRIAKSGIKLGLGFVGLGLHPGMGATYLLPRLVGQAKATEWLLTGAVTSTDEAYQAGLLSFVVDETEFDAEVLALAKRLAAGPRETLTALKKTLLSDQPKNLAEACELEASAQAQSYAGEEFAEGISAAKEKRLASFVKDNG